MNATNLVEQEVPGHANCARGHRWPVSGVVGHPLEQGRVCPQCGKTYWSWDADRAPTPPPTQDQRDAATARALLGLLTTTGVGLSQHATDVLADAVRMYLKAKGG